MAFDRRPHSAMLSLALLVALGCDGENGVIYDDGGVDAPTLDAGRDGGTDAGDREAPSVMETTPADEATDVALDADVIVRFSEPMAAAGTLLVVPGSFASSEGAWNALGDTVTFAAPAEGWPESSSLRASLEGFTDAAGNALPSYNWRFSTSAEAPVVTASNPVEGATDVSARAASIELTFSEPMDNTVGAITATGLTFGDAEWLAGDRVRFAVEGLAYETSYAVTLEGFRDRAGNALDASTYLEGTLDFLTGPDTDAPRVIDSNPDEGQLDVATDLLDEILVVFDEPMDTDVGVATLEVDTRSTPLTAAWNAAGTEVRFSVGGALLNGANHRVVLEGFTDTAGNALDEDVYLLDGALDFRTGGDLVVPFVGYSDPIEGQDDFSFRRDSILVAFSEAMDTSTTTVTLHDGVETTTLTGTWSAAGTRLTLDVTNLLIAGRTYRIDLTGFRDLGGTVVDTAHPYLADGFLDFSMAAPTGENCRDVLTAGEGTTVGGVTTWVIEDRQAVLDDGSGTCSTGGARSADTVIRVTKTSPAVADGGRYLRIALRDEGISREIFVEVFRGVCDPTSPEAIPAREHCLLDNQSWDVHLDGPPGDYYVWIATDRNDAISPVDVIVEEIDAPRQGESCEAPFDDTVDFWDDDNTGLSDRPLGPAWYIDIRNYVGEDDQARIDALDRADVIGGPGSIECDGERIAHAADAVFSLPKTSATSVIDVRMTTVASHAFEVRDACDPTSSTQLACGRSATGGRWRQVTFDGPPGDYALWVAPEQAGSGQKEVDGSYVFEEIEPGPGESCASAIPLVAGVSQALAPSARRLAAPTCFDGEIWQAKTSSSGGTRPTDDGITWYRFTASGAVSTVRFGSNAGTSTNLDPSVALIDATTRSELSCWADSPETGLSVFGNAGREYCVAVLNTPRLTSIELQTFPTYDGVGNTATDLGVLRPFNDTGSEVAITSEQWIGVTPTTLYVQLGLSGTSSGLLRVGKAGGTRAELVRGGLEAVLGYGGATVGESVFLADNVTTNVARIHRAVRDGLVELTAWDPTAGYPARAFYGLHHDGTRLVTATYHSVTAPTAPITGIYALSPTTPGPGTLLGTNALLEKARALASDATWLYLVADLSGATDVEGVYRLPWSDLAATPQVVWQGNTPNLQASLAMQTTGTTTYLYFRDDFGNTHVADVGGATPIHLGTLSTLGTNNDYGLAFDPAGPSLYLFETETLSTGRLVRLD